MGDTVIAVRDLGKCYRLGATLAHDTLRDHVTHGVRRLFGRSPSPAAPAPALPPGSSTKAFWALRHLDFEVQRGEVVGVIGRNGTGKSTLLKILSRITDPTEGEVEMTGRVASLLEVGTGFHPELSGRENIYLNGAILGMRKAEIAQKFDEIVAFAEIAPFIDTPVKRYSSGMYVRLAFAVAAHLESEILLIDEVLAVGDAEFQKKCLGKIQNVASGGRTVLFVSHQLNSVAELCGRCLHLRDGMVVELSCDVRAVIRHYLGGKGADQASFWANTGGGAPNEYFVPQRFYLADRAGAPLPMPVANDQDIWVRIEGEVRRPDPALTIGFALYSESGHVLCWSYPTDSVPDPREPWVAGRAIFSGRVPARTLNEGAYTVELIGGLHFRQWLFEPGRNSPRVALRIQGGLSDSPYWVEKRPGLLAPVFEWTCATGLDANQAAENLDDSGEQRRE